jgi:hypothetical protein
MPRWSGRKIFAKYIFDKLLASKMHRKLFKLNKKARNPIKVGPEI